MHLNLSVVAVGLISIATAAPGQGSLFERAACNRDDCYRVVAQSASKACAAFFASATVTPCGYGVTTVYGTSTVTTPFPAVTYDKRDVQQTPNAVMLDARQASPICTPTTRYDAAVPTFANSKCGTVSSVQVSRYSSACSCNGFGSAAATTLPSSTSTVNSMTTVTVAPEPTAIFTIQSSSGGYISNTGVGPVVMDYNSANALHFGIGKDGRVYVNRDQTGSSGFIVAGTSPASGIGGQLYIAKSVTTDFTPLVVTVTSAASFFYQLTASLNGVVYDYNDECLEKTDRSRGTELYAANDGDYPPANCPYQQKLPWYGIFVQQN